MVQVRLDRLAPSDSPMLGRATLTTVASTNASPEPSTVAATIQRALGDPNTSPALGAGPTSSRYGLHDVPTTQHAISSPWAFFAPRSFYDAIATRWAAMRVLVT